MGRVISQLKKRPYIFGIVIMLWASFAVIFSDCIFDNWKISYSNFMYAVPPFDSLNVAVKGPYLSDVIDSFLPQFYKPSVGITWNNSNIFGYRNVSLELLDIKKVGYLFGLEIGQLVSYIIKYVVAFSGMYLYLKKIKLSSFGAFIGGITFTFSSVMVVWGGWPHTDVTAYAPLLFFLVEDIFEKYKEKSVFNVTHFLTFSIILFFMLVAGMPTYVPFFLYTGVLYLAFRLCTSFDLKKDRKFILLFLGSMVISVFITGLMSFLYTGDTFLSTAEYQETRKGLAFSTLGIEYLRTLIAPYFREGFKLHINESTLFSGFIIMFALPAYILTKKAKKDRKVIQQFSFWLFILIAALVFIFIKQSGIIYQFFPLLNTSPKIRIIVLFNFSAAILSGITCELIWREKVTVNITGSLLLYIVPIVVLAIMKDYLTNRAVLYSIAVIIAIAICLQMILLSERKISPILLCVIVTLNMALFAKAYLPLIPQNVPVIPEATASIKYLQEHTQRGERVSGVGKWTFFPNSNTYYSLSSIAGHSFANTQSDIKEYLTAIDSTIYDTPTRTSLKNIDNQNLLRWASVKYLLDAEEAMSPLSRLDTKIKECGTTRVPYAYRGMGDVVQSFTAEKDFDGISILLSTYGTQLSLNDYTNITVLDEEGNTYINERICLGTLNDNSFYTLQSDMILEAGKYALVISPEKETPFEKPLALWETGKDICGGSLVILGEEREGSISFVINYSSGEKIAFEDGCSITELSECAPRAYLADKIILKDTNEEILNAMKLSYTENTVYLTSDYADQLLTQSAYPESKVIERIDEGKTVTVKVDAAKGSILVLNDYYTQGWTATIDGESADCIRVNYLFRGVILPKDGEQMIEFSYQNSLDILLIAVSISGVALFITVIVTRKRIEKWANKLLQRSE